MGVLFSRIWQSFFNYDEFKVIIIGLNNAGKTTTLYKLYGREISTSTLIQHIAPQNKSSPRQELYPTIPCFVVCFQRF
jgi:GTPase SAR1 family protein